MIVDTSALVAILEREDGWQDLHRRLLVGGAHLSVAGYLELGIVWDARHPDQFSLLDEFLLAHEVDVAPVTAEQARRARAAYRRYGRGSGHRARLNFGDCFSYALAVDRDEPLLFVGDDFGHTDVTPAQT